MNTLNKTILASLLVPGSALAGTEVYQPMTPPQSYDSSPLYQWFVGGSIGYLVDAEDEFYSLHVGRRLGQLGSFDQSVFLEVGFSNLENDGSEIDLKNLLGVTPGQSFTGDADIEATFIPITLNYMLERNLVGKLGFYIGAGAGIAIIDVDGSFDDRLLNIQDDGNDSEISFFAQAFAGLNYALSEQFAIHGGARYMFIDDYEVSTGTGDLRVDDADDFLLEIGARFRF